MQIKVALCLMGEWAIEQRGEDDIKASYIHNGDGC